MLVIHMDKIHTITKQIERIKAELMSLDNMRPGSLSVQSRSWGGEYWQLSYTHRGKCHTEYVREKNREEVQRQVANYRHFRELTKQWVDLAIERCKLQATRGTDSAT
jgi:hypothetical protein